SYALDLDGIQRFTNTSRVDKRHGHTLDVHGLGYQVAGRPRDVRHDGALGTRKRIEQARLAGVWTASQDDQRAFANQPALPSPRDEGANRVRDVTCLTRRVLGRHEVIALVGKVDARLETRDQIEQ